MMIPKEGMADITQRVSCKAKKKISCTQFLGFKVGFHRDSESLQVRVKLQAAPPCMLHLHPPSPFIPLSQLNSQLPLLTKTGLHSHELALQHSVGNHRHSPHTCTNRTPICTNDPKNRAVNTQGWYTGSSFPTTPCPVKDAGSLAANCCCTCQESPEPLIQGTNNI